MLALLVMSPVVNSSDSSNYRVLEVEIVDEANIQVKPEIIRWWFSNKPKIKTTLVCNQDNCSQLRIPGNSSLPVIVYALLSKIQENDKDCWNWYEAEIESTAQQKQIKLTVIHKRTVCK